LRLDTILFEMNIFDTWRMRYKYLEEAERNSYKYYVPNIGFDDGVALYTLIKIHGEYKDEYRVYEMGSGVGYSTLWILYALEDINGKTYLEAVEKDSDKAVEIHNIISSIGHVKTIWRVISDDALNILESSKNKYDFIFVDITKSDYVRALKLIRDRIKGDGYVAFHNAFFPAPPMNFIQYALDHGWEINVIPTRLGLFILHR